MPPRLRGDVNQFWNNDAVGVNGTSAVVDIGRSVENVLIFVTTNAATTINVQVAHTGDITSQGVLPDGTPATFFNLYRGDAAGGIPVSLTFAGAGSQALVVPDLAVMHLRLLSTAAATITAGWLAGSG